MKRNTDIIIMLIILLCSCKRSWVKNTVSSDDMLIEQYKFESYNYCSPNLLFDDDIFGNTMILVTPNNNFLKCTAINDTEYTFSCGRGKREVKLLYKVKCGSRETRLSFDGLSMPKLVYDDEDIIILYLKGGADSWMNYFVYLSKEVVYNEQAVSIDYENRKYVYLYCDDYDNKNVSFIIHDIMSDTRDTIKSDYYKFRNNGYPTLNISDVLLRDDTLFYNIRVDEVISPVRDTILIR